MNLMKHLQRTLPRLWEQVLEDPRRCERKWDFGSVLETVVRALAGGCKTLRELETLTETSGVRIPDTTLHDLLVQIDPEPLNAELAKGVKHASRNHELDNTDLPFRLTVIDGKNISRTSYPVDGHSIRRSQKGCEIYVHHGIRALLASSKLKLLMAQTVMPKGNNENSTLEPFLEQLVQLYSGTKLLEVLSLDAGFTGAHNAQLIRDQGLHYIFALKAPEIHPITAKAIEILGPRTKPERVEAERKNGKHITRALFRCPAPEVKGWSHAQQLWRVHKEVTDQAGKVTTEEHYYVTSLPSSRLSATLVLKTIRMHWEIENNANWVMDTAWEEDSYPWCNYAFELISLLRMIVYNAVARFKLRRLRGALAREWSWKQTLQFIQRALFPIRESFAVR